MGNKGKTSLPFIGDNLPDGVLRTASDLHMRFVQQRAASTSVIILYQPNS